MLGNPTYLTDEQIGQHERFTAHRLSALHGCHLPVGRARHPQPDICRIVRRSCDQGLMISTYGTVSVRWRGNDFLITPPGVPRWDIEPENIVQVKNGMVEAGKIPSRSVAMHQAIYQSNPHIDSIILTQSPRADGFLHLGREVRRADDPRELDPPAGCTRSYRSASSTKTAMAIPGSDRKAYRACTTGERLGTDHGQDSLMRHVRPFGSRRIQR